MPSGTASGLIRAGTPIATAPLGTSVPGETSAWAATMPPARTTARCSTTEPDPTRLSSSIVHPSRWAL